MNKTDENAGSKINPIEVKGLIVNTGFVKGYARIVNNKNDLKKIQIGEIIVAKMTNPDFIIAMEKSVGIITDTGGITSHAAIVARELKKPSITGTKIATQMFKDGDIIELDANNGIARKVK